VEDEQVYGSGTVEIVIGPLALKMPFSYSLYIASDETLISLS
jgi:hypothetical protein